MEESTSSITSDETAYPYPADYEIPFDLFVSKKYNGVGGRGFLRFTDSAGDLVYKVNKSPHKSGAGGDDDDPHSTKLLLDSSGTTLFSITRISKRSWQGFRGSVEEKQLIFKLNKTVDEFARTEFKVSLVGEREDGSKAELRMIGCPYKRSCTIYKDNSIVAETSLMYKLGIGKAFVPRSRFRVTIFPGFGDPILVASLVVVYYAGRKLWI